LRARGKRWRYFSPPSVIFETMEEPPKVNYKLTSGSDTWMVHANTVVFDPGVKEEHKPI